MTAKRVESVVELANRLVPIRSVLEDVNIYVPEFTHGKSIKARCPFADIYHLDLDADKSMRVYSDTNSANCFMGCGYLSPVSTYAKLNGISYTRAAWKLLDRIGHKPKTLDEKWQDSLKESEDLDLGSYTEALLEYCTRVSLTRWADLQYNSKITASLTSLFDVLSKAKSESDALKWLDAAKCAMTNQIEKALINE